MEITSTSNVKVKEWLKYHQKKYRDKDSRFLVEGEHLIKEALAMNKLEVLLLRKGSPLLFQGVKEVYEVSDEIINRLSTNVSKVNYIGICSKLEAHFSSFQKVLLLDDVQDPGNLGTIIRSALSFGFNGIYVSKGCVDVYNEKVIRSTQGALFHIPIKQVDLQEEIKRLKEQGYCVYATALKDAKPLSSIEKTDQVALVFGNEGSGIKNEIMAICDERIYIEMNAFESLNVAVAAGICMYYFREG